MLQVRWNIGKPIKQKDKKRRAAVFDPIANKLASHRDFDLHAEEIVISAEGNVPQVPVPPPKPPPPAKPTITNAAPKKLDVPKIALELLMPEMARRVSSGSTDATMGCEPTCSAEDDIDLLDEIDLHDIANETFEDGLLSSPPPAKRMRMDDSARDAFADFVSDGSTISVEDVLETGLDDFPAPLTTPSDSRKGVAALAYGLAESVLGCDDIGPVCVTEAQMLRMSMDFKLPPLEEEVQPVPAQDAGDLSILPDEMDFLA